MRRCDLCKILQSALGNPFHRPSVQGQQRRIRGLHSCGTGTGRALADTLADSFRSRDEELKRQVL